MPNIIQFKQKTIRKEKSTSDIDDEIGMITDSILSSTLDSLIRSGYNLEDNFDTILSHIMLIEESIKSLQLKLKNKEHYLQSYAESTFIIVNNE